MEGEREKMEKARETEGEREKQRTSPGVLASQGHAEERRPCMCTCLCVCVCGNNSGDGRPT